MAERTPANVSSSPRKRGSSDFVSDEAQALDPRVRGNDEQQQKPKLVRSGGSELRQHSFADLYEMSSGISSTPAQAGHGAPFLSFSTVFNNYFLPEALPDLMDSSDSEQETYSVRAGDIFLTRTSETVDELGMSSVALKDYPHATFSGFLKRLRPRERGQTDPKFMAFYLRSPLFRKAMTNNAVMVLRASLNEQIFSYLKLLLPDFDEQTRIGAFLHLLHAKIDLNNRINAELEALAKTIYDYWFVQFDFPDAHGRPYKSSGGAMVWNETLKRDIPAGWCVLTIGDVILKQPKALKVPASSVQTNGSTPVIDQSTDFICGYTDEADARIEIETPHVVFGDHTRIVKLVCFDYARGADGTQVLVPNTELVAPFAFFQSIARVDLSNYGYARHFKFLKSAHIVVPEISLANGYDEVVRPLFTSVEGNRRQNRELTQLRDWLLPLLMNGQVRVA